MKLLTILILFWSTTAGIYGELDQAELLRGETWLFFKSRTLDSIPDYTVKPANLELSKYGGWKARRFDQGTGFFRVQKVNGRWWAIDPEGYLYVHMALNSVNQDYATPDALYSTMRANGFNGFGNWTDLSIVTNSTVKSQTPMAYIPKISFLATYRRDRLPQTVPRLEMPVFDDAFVAYANNLARDFLPYVNDPHVFGYMTDNELDFKYNGLSAHLAITDPLDKNYTTAIAFLTARGKTPSDYTPEDHNAYMALMAERYYSVVHAAIRSVDTKHMIIGSRCHSSERQVKDFMVNAGKYVDVFSTNHYNRWSNREVETKNMAEWSGRPLLLSEFYTKGADTGLSTTTGAGWYGKNQTARALFYQNFVSTFAESGQVIGFHWFKYGDDTMNCGTMSSTGVPYSELLASMQKMNKQIYDFIDYADLRHAPDITLDPVADAYFEGGTNRGSNPELKVKEASLTSSSTLRQTYLRFDVSSITGTIDSAKIRLRSIANGSESGSFQAELVADDTWGETTIKLSNAPAGSTVLYSWSDGGGDVEIDVTSVLSVAMASDDKLSIRIISTFNNGAIPEYGSKENTDPAARPKLIVYYPNVAPVATNDLYTTNQNTVLTVNGPGVLSNDSDAESDPLSAVLVSGPATGSLTLNTNGSFTYTPANDFTGTTQFTYKTNDGKANSPVATVTLSIQSAFDVWAGGVTTFTEDKNTDGVADGLAWLLGAQTRSIHSSALLPTVYRSGGNLCSQFNLLIPGMRGSALLKLQYSTNLSSWSTVTVPDSSSTVDGVTFVTTPAGNVNQVLAIIPASAAGAGGKLFLRLRGEMVPTAP